MRKREVIELRYKIDCVGRLCTSNGRQQGVFAMREYENTPESESMAYLTLLYSAYPGDLGSSAGKNCGREYRPMQW